MIERLQKIRGARLGFGKYGGDSASDNRLLKFLRVLRLLKFLRVLRLLRFSECAAIRKRHFDRSYLCLMAYVY